MLSLFHRKRVYWLVVSLFLASLACRVEAPRIILEETPTALPTQVQVVTEVAVEIITATPLPTSTPQPTSTPEPTLTPTWDPLTAPIYYPLPDCVASRLHRGDRAMVSLVGGPNAIRYGSDLQYDTILYYAQPGEIVLIVDGPWCSHGWLVWFVETINGVLGYTPEGNGNEYWLFPVK
ncbi:MAG: hypothetical protein AB1894_20530 [Chloroflexota bacterium]